MTNPNLMHETGYSKLVHPVGWDGEGGERGGLGLGDTCTPMADSCQYGKTHHNIVK